MKVSLMITCLGDALFPNVGVATVRNSCAHEEGHPMKRLECTIEAAGMRRGHVLAVAAGLTAGLAGKAAGQAFTNGNFQTGTFAGWTVVNTANGVGAPGAAQPGTGAGG